MKRARKIALLAFAGVALVAAWLAFPGRAPQTAPGMPRSLAEVFPEVSPERNAAIPLTRAIAAFGDEDGPLRETLQRPEPDFFTFVLGRNALLPAFDRTLLPLLESAAARPDLRFPRRYEPLWNVAFAENRPLGAFESYLALSAFERARAGDRAGAWRRLLTGARLVRLIRREPFFLPAMLADRTEVRLIRAARRTLALTGPDPAARAFLAALGPPTDLPRLVRVEWLRQRSIARDLHRQGWRFFWAGTGFLLPSEDASDLEAWLLLTPQGRERADRGMSERLLDYARAIARTPVERADLERNRRIAASGFFANWFEEDFGWVNRPAREAAAARAAFEGVVADPSGPDRRPRAPNTILP